MSRIGGGGDEDKTKVPETGTNGSGHSKIGGGSDTSTSSTDEVIKALTGKKLDLKERQAEAADRYNPYSSNPEVARLQRQRDIILNSANANDPRAKNGLAEIDKLIGQAEQKAQMAKLPKNIVTGNTQFLSPLTPFEDVGKNVIPQSAITPVAKGYDGSGMYTPYNTEADIFTGMAPRFEADAEAAAERGVDRIVNALTEQAVQDTKTAYNTGVAELKDIQARYTDASNRLRENEDAVNREVDPVRRQKLIAEGEALLDQVTALEDDFRAKMAELNENPYSTHYGEDVDAILHNPNFWERAGNVFKAGGTSALAGYTDAERALYASGQERRTAETEEEIASIQQWLDIERSARAADVEQYGEDYAAAVHDPTIADLERRLAAFEQVIPAQEGATEATAEIADRLQEISEAAEQKAKKNLNGVERFVVNMGVQGVQMLSDAAVNLAIGTPQSLIPIFARSFGSATQTARQAGASTDQQILYGTAVGAVEALTEKLFDGLSGLYGKGLADEAFDLTNVILDKVAKEASPAAKRALLLFLGGAGEAVEEGVSSRLDPWLKAIYDNGEDLKETYGSVENWLNSWADTGYEMLMGYAMGFAGSTIGVNNQLNEYENWSANRQVNVPAEIAPAVEAPAVEAPAQPTPADILAQQTAPPVNIPAESIAENAPSITPESVAEAFVPSETPVEQTSIDANSGSEETGVNIPAEQSASETQNNAENEGTVTRAEPAPTEPAGVMKRSQVESNTLQHLAEETGGQQGELYYPSVTEKQTLAAAQARVKQDFTGEMNKLTEKSSWTAEDVDTAFTIQGILQTDGVRTRDFSAAQAWAKVVQDRITRSAQSLQAVSKWSRTGQAIVQDAMVDLSESNISAEEQSQIINDMQALADRLDATEDGDLGSIRQLILDLNSKRNTGTFFKSRFSKYLDTITDFDWLKEFATRQLMSVPADYTETASLGQKLKTWQTLAQLLRLPTFNRNIGGNLTFSGMDALVQDSFGIAIDSLVSKLTGVREVGFNKWWFSSKARQAAGDAYTKSILEVAADIDMTGEGNKYTPGGGRSFKMTGNAAERFLSRLEQLLSYSLTTSDRVSRGQIETANVEGLENANSRMTNAKADMITSDKSLSQAFTDITGVELNGTKADNRTAIKEQADDVVKFLVNEAENETINPAQQALLDVIQRGKMTEERASAIAEQAADYDLFQNESTATRVSKGAHDALNTMGIGGTVDKTGRHGGFGVGDMLNPYPGVPANLGAKPIEFSPAGIAKGTYDLVKLLSDAKNGKTVDAGAQHKAVMEIARGMAGTPIIVALASLFRGGAIKNADDEDDLDAAAQAAAEGRSGVQWNLSATMRLLRGESGEWQEGDDLMSISWLEPLNAFMAIASLVAEDTEEDATLGSVLKSTNKNYLQGSIQSILDMPVMSSISNIVDTFKYSNADTIGGKAGEAAIGAIGDAVSGMMPAPLFSQLAKATDDTMRSTKGDTPLETVVNGILNNIPGLRQTLDPKYDAFGEEKKYTGTDLQRWLNTYLLPGAINKFSQSETGALVESLYEETGSPDVYPDRKAPKSFNVGKDKIQLSADQQTEYQKVYGKAAAGFINDFVNGAGYDDLAPEQKVEILKDLYGFAKNEAENAILEGMGMEPKEKDGYESAKKIMDEAGLSWAEYYDVKKGRDVNGDGNNSQDETVSYLLGSGFDDEKMESIYNALYPNSGNFSEVRDNVQSIEDAGFESLDAFNAIADAVAEAKSAAKDENDSAGNIEAAQLVKDADLTDEQKDMLIGKVSSKFVDFYNVARENGYGANDAIDLLLAIDATPGGKNDTPNNGSVSQGELKAYYKEHPEDEVIIALLWNSKNYSAGTWDQIKGKIK